jgi:HlyD family secretion protein
MAADKGTLEQLRIERPPEAAGQGAPRAALWAAAVVVVLGVAAAWWFLAPRPAEVRVAAVREEAGGAAPGAVLNASGYVTARRQATVSAKVTGKVVEVMIEEGMAVRQGQELARLDSRNVAAQVALAEAQLEDARRALRETEVRLRQANLTRERQRRLHAQAVTSQADVDAADADADSLAAHLTVQRQDVAVAERQLAARRQDLDDTVVRAPFAGMVTTKDAQPGEMISPLSAGGGFTRTGVCTLVDMSSLEIDVDVGESFINRVRPGQHAEAVLDAYPDWRIPATVIAIVPTAERQKATVKVRLSFDKLDPRILPEEGVKVAFLGDEPAAAGGSAPVRTVRVPRAALRQDHGTPVVFVLRGDRVERRAVRVGTAPGDEVAVLSGLAAGDQVVVEGPPDLADGRQVKVR